MSNIEFILKSFKIELKKSLNAERDLFQRKGFCDFEKVLFERKERSVQLLLVIFGFVVSYSWKSGNLEKILPILFFAFTIPILVYYLLLPSSFIEGDEFKKLARILAMIIALSFSLTLILVFITNIAVSDIITGGVLVSMCIALAFLIFKMLYI
jgi:hypothetical protein